MVKLLQYKHFFFLFIYFITYPSVCHSFQDTSTDNINAAVKNVLFSKDHPYFNQSTFLEYKEIINELYSSSPQTLLWLSNDIKNIKNVTDIFQLISTAKNSGLNEEHYHLAFLRSKWDELIYRQKYSHQNLVLLDTAISINLLHFLSDLRYGRIDPQSLNFNFKPLKDLLEFSPLILSAINKSKINKLSDLVEPKIPAYHLLKKALVAYRKNSNTSDYNMLNYISTLRPEETNPQVIAIRQKLNILGIPTNKKNAASCLYDKELVENVKEFQSHHGLKTDGIIGNKTIKALRPNKEQRIHQIELALERLRWLPKIQPGPSVMVNIPAFQLWAYASDQLIDSQALKMKVIVGKSSDVLLKSPVFTAKMHYLEFSPYWNIPKSITIKEIIPKLEKDPFYIEQQNMELVTGFHNNTLPVPYTEDSIAQLRNQTLKLRQRPGRNNALGTVKFIFPNNYNVYLHDTPSRRLFNKPKRDLSHGCIRVEKPTELARFLLKTKPKWNQQKILQSMHLSQPKQVRLSKSVPVIIFYSTAYAIEDKLYFYDDLYDYDAALSQALIEHHITQNKKKIFPTKSPFSNTAGINMNKI